MRSRNALIAVAIALSAVGCRSKRAGERAEPAPDEPAVVGSIGAGQRPVYPKRVPLDSEVRASHLLAVPGTGLAAVGGVDLDGPVLQLIDIDRARVVWTDHRWCEGRLVHATRERLLCASGQGIRAVAVADGELAWSSPRAFRAAGGDRVLAGDALIDAKSGTVVRALTNDGDAARNTRVLCPDGAAYAWSPGGTLWRLTETLEERWSLRLDRAPSHTDLCSNPLLVEVPQPDREAGRLLAVDPETGAVLGAPVEVLGWWPAIGGGVTIADERGIHRRTRALEQPTQVAPAQVAGGLFADTNGLRLARAVGGSLLLIDGEGLRAWMAAPAGAARAVLTAKRVLAIGRLRDSSAAETPLLYELPAAGARIRWPDQPLRPRARARVDDEPIALPAATPLTDAVEVADPSHGDMGIAAVTVAGEVVYVAAHDELPGPNRGAGVAAFDLAARTWSWHQARGCAPAARVIALAETAGVVACAARENDPGRGVVVGIAAATGEVAWRRELRTVDAMTAAGGRFVVEVGARAFVLAAADGEVERIVDSDHGHAPRVVPTAAGLVAIDAGGTLVGPGWRVAIDGYAVGLAATADRVLVNLADGAVYSVDPRTGKAVEVSGYSAGWAVATAADLFFDEPVAPGQAFALRAYRGDGSEVARAVLPGPVRIVAERAGPAAPILLVDDAGAARVVQLDPATGAVVATHRWPPRAFRRGAFSAVAAGSPVAGIVLAKPLAVHLFPPPR